MDVWQLYGVLLSKGFSATMGAPGMADEIKVKGWHLKTNEERELERKKKLEDEKNKLEKSMNQALDKVSKEDRKAYIIIRNLLKANGLNNILNGMDANVKAVILDKIMTGDTWDNALAGVASKLV